jgi:hypothetical protein
MVRAKGEHPFEPPCVGREEAFGRCITLGDAQNIITLRDAAWCAIPSPSKLRRWRPAGKAWVKVVPAQILPAFNSLPGTRLLLRADRDCTQNFEIWAVPKSSTQTLAPSNASMFAALNPPNVARVAPPLGSSS